LVSEFVIYLSLHYSKSTVVDARRVMNNFVRWAMKRGLLN
jgi:hypothetical protein